MIKIKEWKDELDFIDSPRNHRRKVKTLKRVFLASDEANCPDSRCDMLVFLQHLKQLFK